MNEVFLKVCVLVTAAFGLTYVPGLRRRRGRSLLSMRDQGTTLLIFLILGVAEEAVAVQIGWFNERVIAACASGLVAGPWVGLVVGIFMTALAVGRDGLPLWAIGPVMLFAGLAGGWLYRRYPALAGRMPTGFCLTVAVSWLRSALTCWHDPHRWTELCDFHQLGIAPVVEGLGTALVLEIVALARERDEQVQAAARSEVRALQSRMNPHFLFNALNTLAALSKVSPQQVPHAAGKLRHFLRASFDQSERPLVPLREELEVVRAYLEIERLRFGNRLRVEETVPEDLLDTLIPPFSLQPIVENAVQHGLRSLPEVGWLQLFARRHGSFVALSVQDNGRGIDPRDIEAILSENGERVHALALLQRRLRGLFGRTCQIEVRSGSGLGTTMTLRIPLRTSKPGATLKPSAAVASVPGTPALG